MQNGRVRRVLVVLVGLLSALLIGLSTSALVTVRKSFPDTTGEVRLDGLHGTVEIKRDGHGIPQIFADDPADLFFAQGYVQAQDRFYEMDFRRHVTAGRLSELVGKDGLETDELVRTMGWRRVAEQEYEALGGGTRSLLEAYARGVNSYIDGKSGSELSLEYTVLSLTGPDYRPEPWTPVDSVAWVKAMSWDLRSNMTDEIDRAMAARQMSVKDVEALYPDPPRSHRPIVTNPRLTDRDGEFGEPPAVASSVSASLAKTRDAAEALPALLGTGDGIGSNSWVVDGSRSATGEPILANDPHLAPSMPGIWYQVGLHCREVTESCPYDVSGFSFSGMPGVVVGHNRRIAWGVSTMYADVTDLYLERVDGDRYEYKGKQVPLETRRETIKVAGGKSRTITVRSTRHGPLLSDVSDDVDDVGGANAVALQWTALTPRRTIAAVFALDRAQGLEGLPGRGKTLHGAVAEPRLRRRRGQHRLPGAGRHPHPQSRRRPLAGARLGRQARVEGLRALRRAPEGTEPAPGLHRHGEQPGRRRPVPAHVGRRRRPRVPRRADPGPAHVEGPLLGA